MSLANDRACDAIDERRWEDALAHATEAARQEPAWAPPWWNVAVASKHLGRWSEALAAVARHTELVRDVDPGLEWTAGIAATALGDWPRARAAWRVCGFELDADDDAPPRIRLGTCAIRIGGEVAWAERLDPCRAMILTVPRGRRHRDVVLHDGEPLGTRSLGAREAPVFEELAVLERSRWHTWEVRVTEPLAAIEALFEGTDVALEDWGGDVLGVAARHDEDVRPLRKRRTVISVNRVY